MPDSKFQISDSKFRIEVTGLAKRFNRQWLFKDFSYAFQSGNTYAIIGPNGSGKSTLMQMLWGQMPQTLGSITHSKNGNTIDSHSVFTHVSIAAPYQDLIDEFTLEEQVNFHFKLKSVRPELANQDLYELMYLSEARTKYIANFSSGMRQRLRLALALFTEADAYFLDEPGSNLDEQAFGWYLKHLGNLPKEKLVFIASNNSAEYPINAIQIDLSKVGLQAASHKPQA
ncbi:MAG: ATP-binding cassette domain-containing protein [Flammeovirgaceae bacterium]|nr:ATP-binding cassette domain-containing protein [Flammeovirgaceae bacterium]